MADLTQAQLKELLHYDPDTGIFTWKQPRSGVVVGAVAGRKDTAGYWAIQIYRRIFRAHRLAWLYVYGSWPSRDIDHINRARDDNRLCNLREATRSENSYNRLKKSDRQGVPGVYQKRGKSIWLV